MSEFKKLALSALSGINVGTISSTVLTAIFDNFEEAVVVADKDRSMIYVNEATENLFGYTKSQLYGNQTKMLYANESEFSKQGQKRFNTASTISAENFRVRYRRADGEHFLGLTTGAPIRLADNTIAGFIGIIRPSRTSDQSLNTLQKIHNATSNVNLKYDEKVNVLLDIGLTHFGLQIGILSRIKDDVYTVVHCVDRNNELQPGTQFDISGTYCVHTLSANKSVGFHYVGESQIQNHPCYKNFQLESYIGTPLKVGGELFGTLNFSSSSPSEPYTKDDFILMELLADTLSYLIYMKQSEETMRALATTDELTGLPNRRATFEKLTDLMNLSDRSSSSLAVLSIDLDHFKQINDRWGHAGGDQALKTFSKAVSQLGRKTDLLGRVGGEEFIFLLPSANKDSALAFAEDVRRILSENPVSISPEKDLYLTASIGVTLLEQNDTQASLMARVDKALYQAKSAGRDCVKFE